MYVSYIHVCYHIMKQNYSQTSHYGNILLPCIQQNCQVTSGVMRSREFLSDLIACNLSVRTNSYNVLTCVQIYYLTSNELI